MSISLIFFEVVAIDPRTNQPPLLAGSAVIEKGELEKTALDNATMSLSPRKSPCHTFSPDPTLQN